MIEGRTAEFFDITKDHFKFAGLRKKSKKGVIPNEWGSLALQQIDIINIYQVDRNVIMAMPIFCDASNRSIVTTDSWAPFSSIDNKPT
jgi:hypothetical protein